MGDDTARRVTVRPLLLAEVELEMAAALEKHKPMPVNDPVRCAGLLCEEAGEAMKAALDATRLYTPPEHSMDDRGPEYTLMLYQHGNGLRYEIRQVAAAALNWLNALDELERRVRTK